MMDDLFSVLEKASDGGQQTMGSMERVRDEEQHAIDS